MHQELYLSTFAIVCYSFAITTICLERLFCCLTMLRHPPSLEDIKSELEVKIVFLSPNATSMLQPMDQGVMFAFKVYYLRHTLQEMI